MLGAVVSTTHLKMKFPTEGRVVTMRIDQEVARKCYERSLRSRQDAYSVSQFPACTDPPETELDPRPITNQGP